MAHKHKSLCIVAGCDRESRVRGVCSSCYVVLQKQVQAGTLTWQQAEKAGLVLRPRRRSPMRDAIEQATEGQA